MKDRGGLRFGCFQALRALEGFEADAIGFFPLDFRLGFVKNELYISPWALMPIDYDDLFFFSPNITIL